MSDITPKDFDFVAQNAHMLGGALAVFGFAAMFGPWHAVTGAGAVMVFAAVKEFWYDAHYETAAIRGSNGRDFWFYVTGVAAALALYGASLIVRS